MRKKHTNVILSLSVLCCGLACGVLTCGPRTDGITRLLPSESVRDGWTPADVPEVYEATSLYDFINGGAEIFFEYGFRSAVYQRYEMGNSSLDVEIYEMTDDAAAFGIFSVNKSPRAASISLGGGGQKVGDYLSFWQQNYYVVVRVTSVPEPGAGVGVEVAREVERKIGDYPGTVPEIVSLLPTAGKVVGSEMLLRGNIALNQVYYLGEEEPFGLTRDRQAAVATYRIGDDDFRLLVAKYDTEVELDDAFRRTAKLFSDKFGSAEQSETQVKAQDKEGKSFLAAKRGRLLSVALGAQTADLEDIFSLMSG